MCVSVGETVSDGCVVCEAFENDVCVLVHWYYLHEWRWLMWGCTNTS